MNPTLTDEDKVRIIPVNPGDLQPGVLVAYMDARGQIITHRVVVKVEGERVITKGDNRGQDDPPVPFKQILGRMEAVNSTK